MMFDEYCTGVKKQFKRNDVNGTTYFTVEDIDKTGLFTHGFFSRKGGVSKNEFESLNFSFSREPARENIIKNLKIVCGVLDIGFDTLSVVNYEHGKGVVIASNDCKGMGITKENTLPYCDGMIVPKKGITAVTMHADCVPIFFADALGNACGVCHAGWKGTHLRIADEMILSMEQCGCKRENMLIGIGPCIRSCCFEVQENVGGLFAGEYGEDVRVRRGDSQYVDLQRVILKQLFEAGIPAKNVSVSELCTSCEKELFYSHRRDHGKTGAMASFMCFK